MWRVSAVVILCVALGVMLLCMAAGPFDASSVPGEWYPFREAYTAGALAVVFLVFGQSMYLHDGVLLLRNKLRRGRHSHHPDQ